MVKLIETRIDVSGRRIIPSFALMNALDNGAVSIKKSEFDNHFMAPAIKLYLDDLQTTARSKEDGSVNGNFTYGYADLTSQTVVNINLLKGGSDTKILYDEKISGQDVIRFIDFFLKDNPKWHRYAILGSYRFSSHTYPDIDVHNPEAVIDAIQKAEGIDGIDETRYMSMALDFNRWNRKTLQSFVRQYGILIDVDKGISSPLSSSLAKKMNIRLVK